ncbi:MAG TPA: hypothetical protein VE650_21100 [Acetobacteraceae bacterium]|nr:hypothetical protein [Acetobacteraceae bacterium]
MVLRRQYGTGSPFALVCCGTETDVRKAMAAAEEQAYRLGASAPTLCGT